MILGSLFAGIGGFELAATWAGIEPIWSNEMDPFCCKVLRKNFNHEIIEKDIRSLKGLDNGKIIRNTKSAGAAEVGKIPGEREGDKKGSNTERICSTDKGGARKSFVRSPDILTGGFPCQPFSHAGKRKGKDDDRYLWPEYLRLIRELRPTWVIGENVAGLVSMENGRTLERILAELEDENYQTEVYNIPACGVGAWHKRERIWIVCHTTGKGFQDGRGSQVGQPGKIKEPERPSSKDVPNTISTRPQRRDSGIMQERRNKQLAWSGNSQYNERYWQFEPNVGRVANGIPRRVDRLKGLGNAIVPQVAYEIFKAIVNYENTHSTN